uniref:Uncharacterized protein n=1 Tax=Ditylenchus dipsaci TaxID=166011 RepID=A0A915E087_9BILA
MKLRNYLETRSIVNYLATTSAAPSLVESNILSAHLLINDRSWIRYKDSFNYTKSFDQFDMFIYYYMRNLGFNHLGSNNSYPSQLLDSKWSLGVELAFTFMEHNTGCDFALHLIKQTGSNCSRFSKANGLVYIELNQSSNFFKLVQVDEEKFDIEMSVFGGQWRLFISEYGNHNRWLRLRCYSCGAWLDVQEDCYKRTVNAGNAGYGAAVHDVYGELPTAKVDGFEVVFSKTCEQDMQEINKLLTVFETNLMVATSTSNMDTTANSAPESSTQKQLERLYSEIC